MSVWRESFVKKIKWVLLLRLIIFFSIFGASIIAGKATLFLYRLFVLYAVIVLCYLLTLFFWRVTQKELSFRFLCGILISLEILLEIAIIHYTGGITSPFTILLALSIVSSSLVFQLAGTLVIASLGVIVYVTLIILEYNNVLPFNLQSTNPYAYITYNDKDTLFFATYTYSCFLYLVAFISGYLSEKLRARINELELKSLELERVKLDTKEILKHLPAGLIGVDNFGNISYLNQSAKDLLKLNDINYEGQNIKDVIEPCFAPIVKKLESLYWKFDQTDEVKEELELNIQGFKRIFFVVFSVLRFKTQSRGYLILLEDITNQKKKEAYLKSLEKLAALGRLSFGLAHELRNPLASIRGSAEVLRSDDNDHKDSIELLSLIEEESDRLSEIIEDFLQFALIGKERKIRLFPVPLTKIVNEVITELKNHPNYSTKIEIITRFPKEELWVKGEIDSLKQVFLNLILNAIEAIGDELGKVIISCDGKSSKLDENRNVLSIKIEDNGKGMDSESYNKLFEPLYTTKKGGVGLGLSIVQRLISEMQGYIEVDTQLNKGSTFTLSLLSD